MSLDYIEVKQKPNASKKLDKTIKFFVIDDGKSLGISELIFLEVKLFLVLCTELFISKVVGRVRKQGKKK